MLARQKWFERKFDFSAPPSQFPNILERLRGTPARLEERTAGLDRSVLTRRDGEHWTIQEHAGHLVDLESLWHERAQQLIRGDTELVAADLTNRKTHDAGHNARTLTDILGDFRGARREFLQPLVGADEAFIVRSALHPRLQQPMRLIDLALFVADHDDHHLASITELRRKWGAP